MKVLRILAVVAVALVVISLGVIRYVGAWKLLFPDRTHETAAPVLPATLAKPAVLLFTKTNSFRHVDGIRGGVAYFEALAARRGFGLFHTENGAVFDPEVLARFDAVVFHNATGDMLSDAQESAFRTWLEAGGGWLGVHAAGDGSHEEWTWYHQSFIGGHYLGHPMSPQFQEARVVIEDRGHPATRALPETWTHEEEWYSWAKSAREGPFNVLVSVDESTYQPRAKLLGMDQDLTMGDHPVMWWRCIGGGRAFYTALGHQESAYASPEYQGVLEGALDWVLGLEEPACP